MSEIRPILFSDEMVRAILDGRKTQTRRVVGSIAGRGRVTEFQASDTLGFAWTFRDRRSLWNDLTDSQLLSRCPLGKPGDRLWVREAWAHYQTVNHTRKPDGRAFSEVSDGLAAYRADGYGTIEDFRKHVKMMSGLDLEDVIINGDRWRPSIHMPRWASRITLEITDIRCQRLQDISEEDAIAEGVVCPRLGTYGMNPETVFRALWDSTAKPCAKWEDNPWVWAFVFTVYWIAR